MAGPLRPASSGAGRRIALAAAVLGVVSIGTQVFGSSSDTLRIGRTVMGLAWAAYAGLTWCLLLGDFLRRRAPILAPGSGAASYELGKLSLGQIVDRSVAVSTVTLPRFLGDPAAHLVAAYWIVPALVCSYVFLEPTLTPRLRVAFWLVAGIVLFPWGAGLSPHWPAFQ